MRGWRIAAAVFAFVYVWDPLPSLLLFLPLPTELDFWNHRRRRKGGEAEAADGKGNPQNREEEEEEEEEAFQGDYYTSQQCRRRRGRRSRQCQENSPSLQSSR